MAEWLCTGLQIRVDRFDSGLRLQMFKKVALISGFFCFWAPSGLVLQADCSLVANQNP